MARSRGEKMKIRYGIYGQGDFKSKEWFIYDHRFNRLVSGEKFKTRKEALARAEILNQQQSKKEV